MAAGPNGLTSCWSCAHGQASRGVSTTRVVSFYRFLVRSAATRMDKMTPTCDTDEMITSQPGRCKGHSGEQEGTKQQHLDSVQRHDRQWCVKAHTSRMCVSEGVNFEAGLQAHIVSSSHELHIMCQTTELSVHDTDSNHALMSDMQQSPQAKQAVPNGSLHAGGNVAQGRLDLCNTGTLSGI